MTEVKDRSDIECYKYYVVRDDKLYKLGYSIGDRGGDFIRNKKMREEILLPDEYVCWLADIAGDHSLMRLRNFTGEFTSENFDQMYDKVILQEIANFDYYNIKDIKNFILGIGEFKDWRDIEINK